MKTLLSLFLLLALGASAATGIKISEYPNTPVLTNSELFIVAVTNTTPATNRNITYGQLRSLLSSNNFVGSFTGDGRNASNVIVNASNVVSGGTLSVSNAIIGPAGTTTTNRLRVAGDALVDGELTASNFVGNLTGNISGNAVNLTGRSGGTTGIYAGGTFTSTGSSSNWNTVNGYIVDDNYHTGETRKWAITSGILNSGALEFRHGTSIGGDPYAAGQQAMAIDNGGFLGIGPNYYPPMQMFDVNGKVVINGTTGCMGVGTTNPLWILHVEKSSSGSSSTDFPSTLVRNTNPTKGNGTNTFNIAEYKVISGNGLVHGGLWASYDDRFQGIQVGSADTNDVHIVISDVPKATWKDNGDQYVHGSLYSTGTIYGSASVYAGNGILRSFGTTAAWATVPGWEINNTYPVDASRRWAQTVGLTEDGTLEWRVSSDSTNNPWQAGHSIAFMNSSGWLGLKQTPVQMMDMNHKFVVTENTGYIGIGVTNPAWFVHAEKSSTGTSSADFPCFTIRNTSPTQGNGSSTANIAEFKVISGNGLVHGGLWANYSAGVNGIQVGAADTNDVHIVISDVPKATFKDSGDAYFNGAVIATNAFVMPPVSAGPVWCTNGLRAFWNSNGVATYIRESTVGSATYTDYLLH